MKICSSLLQLKTPQPQESYVMIVQFTLIKEECRFTDLQKNAEHQGKNQKGKH